MRPSLLLARNQLNHLRYWSAATAVAVGVMCGLVVAGSGVVAASASAVGGVVPVSATPQPTWLRPVAWTYVDRANPEESYWNTTELVGAGRPSGSGPGMRRAYFQYDLTSLLDGEGRDITILAAGIRPTIRHSGDGCVPHEVALHHVRPISPETTWEDRPESWGVVATVSAGKDDGNADCPAGPVELDLTTTVAAMQRAGKRLLTLALYAGDETDARWYKAFQNDPPLDIEYNTAPQVPTAMAMTPNPGQPCPSEHAGYINANASPPSFRVTPYDPDGGNVSVEFAYGPVGSPQQWTLRADNTASGVLVTRQVPAGQLLDGGEYEWAARTDDGYAVSAWTPVCRFGVDNTRPTTVPTVTSTDFPAGRAGLPYGQAGEFTFDAHGDPDVVAYRYGFDDTTPHQVAVQAGEPATVLLTPPGRSLNTLYVRGMDRARNLTSIATYDFLASAASGPRALYPPTEGQGTTVADSSGNGHTATLSEGVTWTAGRQNNGHALRFDGVGHAATAGPVVRTDRNFSVAAWVKLANASGSATVVSQDGDASSGFFLQFDKDSGKWAFRLPQADATVPTPVAVVRSLAPAAVGEWTHLVGVYDAGSRQIQLYVDGLSQGTAPTTAAADAQGPLRIGVAKEASDGGFFRHWVGELSGIAVYDRVLFASDVQALVNGPALAGHWTLDETSGVTAGDTSPNQRPVTFPPDTTWGAGRKDGAVELTGTGCGETTGPVVRTDRSFTVAAWVNLADDSRSATVLSQRGTAASGFYLEFDSASRSWVFWLPHADTATPLRLVEAQGFRTPQVGVWTHLAAVYDGVRGQLRLYVDGLLSGQVAGRPSFNAAGPLLIGAGTAGVTVKQWRGGVDDVRVYEGVLADAEIRTLAA